MKCYVGGVGPEKREEELRNCKLGRFYVKGKIKRHGKILNSLSKLGCVYKYSTQNLFHKLKKLNILLNLEF